MNESAVLPTNLHNASWSLSERRVRSPVRQIRSPRCEGRSGLPASLRTAATPGSGHHDRSHVRQTPTTLTFLRKYRHRAGGPESRSRATTPGWLMVAAGVGAAAVSMIGSGYVSLWTDEAATISAATRSLPDLLRMLGTIDVVHGAYYAFMHFWTGIFGSLRSGCGCRARWPSGRRRSAVYLLGSRWSGRTAGVLAAVVFAVLPRVTYLGIEARPFAFATALAAWATYRRRRLRTAASLALGRLRRCCRGRYLRQHLRGAAAAGPRSCRSSPPPGPVAVVRRGAAGGLAGAAGGDRGDPADRAARRRSAGLDRVRSQRRDQPVVPRRDADHHDRPIDHHVRLERPHPGGSPPRSCLPRWSASVRVRRGPVVARAGAWCGSRCGGCCPGSWCPPR